jgi:hypothetical protein
MKFHCTIRREKAAVCVMFFVNYIPRFGEFHDGCVITEGVTLSRLLASVACRFVEASISFPAEFSRPWMPWALHLACEACLSGRITKVIEETN